MASSRVFWTLPYSQKKRYVLRTIFLSDIAYIPKPVINEHQLKLSRNPRKYNKSAINRSGN